MRNRMILLDLNTGQRQFQLPQIGDLSVELGLRRRYRLGIGEWADSACMDLDADCGEPRPTPLRGSTT